MEELLKQKSKIKSFKKSDVLFQEKAEADGIYFVKSGTIKVFREDFSGRQIILRLARAGDVLAPYFLTPRKQHLYSARALDDLEIYHVGHVELLSIDKNRIYSYLLDKTGVELSHVQTRYVELMKKSVRERLACHFSEMATHHSVETAEGLKVKVRLSREEIASMIGTAHETAIRFIGEFKDEGLIKEEDKSFYILNPEKLSEIAASGLRMYQ